MSVESVAYIGDLNPALPGPADPKSEGDDHLRNLKLALAQSLAGYPGAILVTGADGGAANAYTITPSRAIPAYGLRMKVVFSPSVANGGASTINISGIGVKPLRAVDGSELAAGDLVVGAVYAAYYNGAEFRMAAPTKNYIDAVRAYASQLAFNSALPNQASNAGKGVGTSGTAARWEYFGVKVAPVAGGSLVDANCVHALMANVAYTLPDFTGSQTFGLMAPSNAAAVPASVTTADGWSIATGFTAGTLSVLSPSATPTKHGIWAGRMMTPPALGTSAQSGTVVGTAQLTPGLVVALLTSGGNGYVVAINTTTGAMGAAVSLGPAAPNGGIPMTIYADTASTFVVGYNNGSITVQAGSVNIGTLAITLGSVVVGTYSMNSVLTQLQPGTYMYSQSNIVEVFVVNGTAVAKGAPTTVGTGTLAGTSVPIRIDNTRALVVGFSSVSSPCSLAVMVVTVSGSTPSGGTVVNAASSILKGSVSIAFLRALAAGGPFVCCAQDNTTATTGDYYAITVSGTTPTIGAILQVPNGLPSQSNQTTWQYPPASDASLFAMPYNASTLLVGVGTGAYAFNVSGTTLTVGSVFGSASTKFVTDAATGVNFYAVTSSAISKITVSGTAISSSSTVAISPVVVGSDTLNDKAINYSGTWYSWTLPAMSAAITPTRWLSSNGTALYGDIS